ncbi:MAG: helix-turn-helix domain-containing protein [Chloroflexota bacterium]
MPNEPASPTFVSTQEAAEWFHVSRMTINRWIKAGRLQAQQVGGRWLIPKSQLTTTAAQSSVEDSGDQTTKQTTHSPQSSES